MKKGLLAASLVLASTVASAETFDINVGSDSFRAELSGPLSRVFSRVSGEYNAGVVYKEGDDNSGDFKDAQLKLAHFGVLATGDAGGRGVKAGAGLGARVVYADRSQRSFSGTGGAVALGGQFDVRLPGYERVGLTGYGYIAPSVIAFGDLNRYHEYAVDVEFEVVRAAALYAGYRAVAVKLDAGGPSDADSSGHIGLRLRF